MADVSEEAIADKLVRDVAKAPKIGTKWKHVKTGVVYTVRDLCVIEKTLTLCVLYVSHPAGLPWVRPVSEWEEVVDGKPRFVPF